MNNQKYSAELDGEKDYGSNIVRLLQIVDFKPSFPSCVTQNDIKQVSLKAQYGGNDGWFVVSINTFVAKSDQVFTKLTSDPTFNKWVDYDQVDKYPYNARQNILSLSHMPTPSNLEDILSVQSMRRGVHKPPCGYGKPVCECRDTAAVCIFNLEIDEIRTFTSYRKYLVDEGEGMFVRGVQGVLYHINNGTIEYLPQYSDRHCAKDFTPAECSDPQFVDGKPIEWLLASTGRYQDQLLLCTSNRKSGYMFSTNCLQRVYQFTGTVCNNMTHHGWMEQIEPESTYTYMYTASPSGTFWYHSHTGAQRTDGFFGALIVKETKSRLEKIKTELCALSVRDFQDRPDKHTIILIDWHHESFSQLYPGLGFYPDVPIGEVPKESSTKYQTTRSYENAGVGPLPYFSGLINGKGRHPDISYLNSRLSIFMVEEGQRYRFRLVGSQGLYAYKFSIDGHKLTVVNTDGYWTKPQEPVDYIIIHTGERYDFILAANATFGNYWIRAETLEINTTSGFPFKSMGHVAEAILQYTPKNINDATEICSSEYQFITSQPPTCDRTSRCVAINCPFEKFHYNYFTKCINIQQLELTKEDKMPEAYPDPGCTNCLHFFNFNFEGNAGSASINGRNFILPPVPPQTQHDEFYDQANICNKTANCNPSTLECSCTHVVDIPYKKTIQFVLTSVGSASAVHPIHLHGHTFHVVHIGYPTYNDTTSHSKEIKCCDDDDCKGCTVPGWWNSTGPLLSINNRTVRKDTVMVPAGGYVVINFISDNPAYWFMHCHIEVHQLEGMALIVREGSNAPNITEPPENLNKCGDFSVSDKEFNSIRSTMFGVSFEDLLKTQP